MVIQDPITDFERFEATLAAILPSENPAISLGDRSQLLKVVHAVTPLWAGIQNEHNPHRVISVVLASLAVTVDELQPGHRQTLEVCAADVYRYWQLRSEGNEEAIDVRLESRPFFRIRAQTDYSNALQRLVMEALARMELEELRLDATALDDLGFGLDVVPVLLFMCKYPPAADAVTKSIKNWHDYLFRQTLGPDAPALSPPALKMCKHLLRITPFAFVFSLHLVCHLDSPSLLDRAY